MRIPSRSAPALALALALALPVSGSAAAAVDGTRAAPRWKTRIDSLVKGRRMSVVVAVGGAFRYRHLATAPRTPASNEKLLLSMALLDRLGPDLTVPTTAKASAAADDEGVIVGPLWIVGRGDPEVDRTTTAALAKQLRAAGVTRVRGRVKGSTGYFGRDWWATGWKSSFPADEIPLPTALTFLGNVGPGGAHVREPERLAAASLISQLKKRGIEVTGRAGLGRPGGSLVPLASVDSSPLRAVIRRMDVDSLNFHAEVLGKLLAALTTGPPGTIAAGAHALASFERDQGVGSFAHFDSSGLSYANRVRAQGIVRLLWAADAAPWGSALRRALPRAGQGTLRDRLKGVRVRAKTGTLTDVSALSGWVWLERRGEWGEFSILSRGMSKTTASRIEDAIVRTVSSNAG